MSTEALVGTGINAVNSDKGATGRIRFLDPPEEVLGFVDGPDVEETVVISRGGTSPPATSCWSARATRPPATC